MQLRKIALIVLLPAFATAVNSWTAHLTLFTGLNCTSGNALTTINTASGQCSTIPGQTSGSYIVQCDTSGDGKHTVKACSDQSCGGGGGQCAGPSQFKNGDCFSQIPNNPDKSATIQCTKDSSNSAQGKETALGLLAGGLLLSFLFMLRL